MATAIHIHPLGLDYVRRFTDAYRAHSDDIYKREAACEAVQFPAVLVPPRPGDFLAGKRIFAEVGYSLQYGGLGYYAAFRDWDLERCPEQLSAEDRKEWEQLRQFWERENTSQKAYDALSDEAKRRMPETFMTAPVLTRGGYPIPRVAGLQLDLSKLVELGISGLREAVSERSGQVADEEKRAFLGACQAAVDRLEGAARYYLDTARSLETMESLSLVRALEGILDHRPETFHEGLQLIQLAMALTATNNYGRLDMTLGPLLCRDLDAGRLTWEMALRLMEQFYTLLEEEYFHTDARIIVGGKGRGDATEADRFALLAMETTERLSLPLPQLTLRFHRAQNPDLLAKAYAVIGKGKTFPMLYNDEVNVPAVEQAFGVDEATAQQYLPFGCGETMIHHQSVGSPNAIINLMRCLESAMNHGRCLSTGIAIGPDLGGLETYEHFDALWEAYTGTVDYYLEPLAEGQTRFYQIAGSECPFSLASLLYDDCLKRGKSLCAGGARYLGGSNETYGNVDAADSLTAIQALVYDSQGCSRADLLEALRSNWGGHDALRARFKAEPKFGNDDDPADAMVMRVHDHICHATRDAGAQTSLHHFLVVVINNNYNTIWGLETSASPNGRRDGDPLAPGNAPGAGCDQSGLTAVLNSQAKPDPTIHAGAVQNVRISASFPRQHPELFATLFQTYFDRGGTQAMVTVTSREDLLDALEYPERYSNLLVRVGGFSARFIDLDPDTQREILSRTEHG